MTETSQPLDFRTAIWEDAARIDPSVTASRQQRRALAEKQLRPVSFSRHLLFCSMQQGRPLLTEGLTVPVAGAQSGVRDAVLRALLDGFPRRRTVRVEHGPHFRAQHIPMRELVDHWTSGRKITVTDLHIRGTRVLEGIDCTPLSDFNLLAGARAPVGVQEMLTMVVSSAGMWTDSHTDDPDGSNHCFHGRKLWLAWDTFLGAEYDLEDHSRARIKKRNANFSIDAFLAVPGSLWFLVEPGQTLFLPGHLAHKVITLEDYLGVGSFFVMLPSYLRTLLRWTVHTPSWSLFGPRAHRLDQVDRITRLVTAKIAQLAEAGPDECSRWGLPYLQNAIKASPPAKEILSSRASTAFLRLAART
jgi:hypothetical protein